MGDIKKHICTKCHCLKSIHEYYFSKKSGRYGQCKDCHNAITKKWKEQNRERLLSTNKEYNDKMSEYRKSWYLKNSERLRAANSKRNIERRRVDPQYKARHISSILIGTAIRNNQKTGIIIDALGCSVDELKKHLEAKFKSGMTWENRGRFGWHIDHIRPLSSFNLLDPDQFSKANHYTNLQPLWWGENLKKSNGLGV